MAQDSKTEGEHEENVYGDEAREGMMGDDEISPEEDAFMEGYEHADEIETEKEDVNYEEAFEEGEESAKEAPEEE